MKVLSLMPKSSSKVSRGERELSEKDVTEFPRGLIPGEWICIHDDHSKKYYVGYCNPFSENFFKIKIVSVADKEMMKSSEVDVAKNLIEAHIRRAVQIRSEYKNYQNGSRIVHGLNDGLPGLIVDSYQDVLFIQINTAGIDRFRKEIGQWFSELFPKHKVLFFDNAQYRKAEVLPVHELNLDIPHLLVNENGLNYQIPSEVVQKIGYYYDHRENRKKAKDLISSINKSFEGGLDLFSYVGSWGLHLLQAGVHHVTFVDQGAMEQVTNSNLELNNFSGRGQFLRADVFKYLDEANVAGKKFDVVVSDPPAFTKSEKNKNSAILGYEKLHTKAMKLINDNGVFVVASCTHYVSFEELDKTVQEAAFKNGKIVHLLDLGVQGHDHPFTGFNDKGFYIKYIAYRVHRGL